MTWQAASDHIAHVRDGGLDVPVHVWPADAERAPVVVAFHGLTDAGDTFAGLARTLKGRCHLVAPDAPGHGLAPWAHAERYDYNEHIPQALAVLRHLDEMLPGVADQSGPDAEPPVPVVIVGHSLGAMTAIRAIAAADPATRDRVRHLVLLEPPRRAPLEARNRRWDRELMARMKATDIDGRIKIMAPRVTWSPEDLRVWAASKDPLDSAIFDVPTRWGESFPRTLRRITTPITLVLGKRPHSEMPPWRLWWVRRSCSGSCEVMALDGGHSPHREAAEQVAELVVRLVQA